MTTASDGVPDRTAGPPTPPLGRAAVHGVVWQGLSFMGGKLLTLISTIVLARLLTPDDFGVVALALVFITYAEVITDLGISQGLIFHERDRRLNDAAITLSLLWSAVLVGATLLSAPLIAQFFESPEVSPMIRALSLSLVFGAVGGVPDALLRKHLNFHRRLFAIVGRAATRGGVSIALAAWGFGAWAIVWGYVGSQAAWALIGWIVVDHRPSPSFWRVRWAQARPLLAFGLPAAGNGLLLSLVFNVDYLIVGERLGARALGFYTIAYRIPEMLIIHALWVVSAVAFPVYSAARSDVHRLQRGYLMSVRLQTFYGMATGVGLAMVAPMLVPVVFGAQWIPSVAALQGISLYAVFASLAKGAMDLYKGVGRPGLAVWMSLLRLGLVLPALLLATRYGIEGVAWAHAASSFVIALILQGVAVRLLRLPVTRLAAALVPAVAIAIGTVAGAAAARAWAPGGDVLRLAAAVVAGAVGGLALAWIVDRRFFSDAWALLRPRRADAPAARA